MSTRPSLTLSEAESKALVASYGVPVGEEFEVTSVDAAIDAAARIDGPVVLKLCGAAIAHKTERGLVRLKLDGAEAVGAAARELLAAATPDDGAVSLLVAPMVSGAREFIVGMLRDAQFGPMVMLGLGGVLAEATADVAFRPAPVDARTAHGMIAELRARSLFEATRGEARVDRDAVVSMLVGLGQLGVERSDVLSVDINPLIVRSDGSPVAVDALVEIAADSSAAETIPPPRHRPSTAQFQALFEPRGVLVTGASSHPGKFGFVSMHNILASGYQGAVYGTNLSGEEVLGVQTLTDIEQLPAGVVDLVFVCTPAAANPDLLRACAAKGIRAAFLTSAGYGEAGPDGQRAERDLVELADELGIVLAGPNGQGVVSTPVSLCAQIVAPAPARGSISVASQSGNFVSSFLNLSRSAGVGIARAVSAGNAAAVSVADYLEYFATDDETSVSFAYLEGITDGARLLDRLGAVAATKPLVVLKGGATESGAQAASSHTGALAADDRLFDGACRAGGITRAWSIEEAFEAAATFATQPVPQGPNVVVLTTAGGWGVVTADAIAREDDLRLLALPEDLLSQIDTLLPPRWSRNNPVDCAGGETRDTIPAVMEMIASHRDVDAVIYLGIGIQSNQARMMREGRYYPDHGLERIVDYHERQDARFAQAAAELSQRFAKPIMVATELAVADPTNSGPAAVRATGRYCYPSGERAVRALGHLYRYANHHRSV